MRRDYVANHGCETYLTYDDPKRDIPIGLLRLRKCSEMIFHLPRTSQYQEGRSNQATEASVAM